MTVAAENTNRLVKLRPVAERSITERILHWASVKPDSDVVRCATTRQTLTYAQMVDQGLGFADLLRRAGVSEGDHVGIMVPNGLEWVVSWAATTLAGFVDVGIDPEARAAMLRHYVISSDAKALVCTVDQVASIRDAGLTEVVLIVWGGTTTDQHAVAVPAELHAGDATVVHRDPRADMSIRFTSGTTGPAKPTMLTQSHLEVWASHFNELMQIDEQQVLYTPFPLSHHLASVLGVLAMSFGGGTCVIDERFSLSRYWDVVRREGVTRLHTIQPMINILMSAPESASDRDHAARLSYIGVPGTGFEERFGVDLLIAYGLTEGSMLTYQLPGDPGPGSATAREIGGQVLGRRNPHFDVEVLDEWDQPCPPGERGDVSFRPKSPFLAVQRYHNNETATLSASSNQWFHTGDVGAFDTEGYLHFFGRSGDTIRRKGHNIPVFHVEEAARACDNVRDACVIPIPLDGNEFDLKLILIPSGDAGELDPRDVLRRLREQLPGVMVPSYVEVRTSVPLTRTYKIQKTELRAEGVNGLTPTTLRTSDWQPAIEDQAEAPT